MAGFNLYLNDTKVKQDALLISNLKVQEIWEHTDFFLTSWLHSGYPWRVVSEPEFEVYIEGKIYNHSENQVDKQLHQLVEDLRSENIDSVRELITDFDGDFILIIYDKITKRISLLNDIFARLPIYYAKTPKGLIVSRNQISIVNILNKKNIDKFAVAELLLLGFFISNRTLIENISKFAPGSLLSIDVESKKWQLSKVFRFNFDARKADKKNDYNKKIKNLVDLFNKSVRQRVDEINILGLSGGLDSRVIAASLSNQDIKTRYVSRVSSKNEERQDVSIAKKLAEILSVNHQVVTCSKPNEVLHNKLLALKLGLNDVGNLNNIAYEQELLSRFGNNFTYLTGCGGDWLKPFYGRVPSKNPLSLVEKLINNTSSIDVNSLFYLLGVDREEFIEYLVAIVSELPENTMLGKYQHLLVYGHGFRYDFEGEDRKRNFFWTTTPFFSNDFFRETINFTHQEKKGYKVYFDFMHTLHKDITKIINREWGLAPNNKLLPLLLMLRENINLKYKIKFKNMINALRGLKNLPDQRVLKLEGDFNTFNNLTAEEIIKSVNLKGEHSNLYTIMLLEIFLNENNTKQDI